jgi:hypothetical protein
MFSSGHWCRSNKALSEFIFCGVEVATMGLTGSRDASYAIYGTLITTLVISVGVAH